MPSAFLRLHAATCRGCTRGDVVGPLPSTTPRAGAYPLLRLAGRLCA